MCEVEFQESMTHFLQEKIRIVMYCFYRFGPEFRADGVQTANLLFSLMRNKECPIWEEALLSLITVITNLRDRAADLYTTERITNLIRTAMESESPGVITNVVMALGRFYQSLRIGGRDPAPQGRELLDRLPDSFDLIVTCLNDDRFTAGFYPKLLASLAAIIKACARYVAGDVRERLFAVYWNAYRGLNCEPRRRRTRERRVCSRFRWI
jgi:hypothetical protein